MTREIRIFLSAASAGLLGLLGTAWAADATERFATPDAAVATLVEAIRAGDSPKIIAVLGPESQPLVQSGDDVEDKRARERFLAAFDQSHHIKIGTNQATLLLGKDAWPWPFPLQKSAAGWAFDEGQGADEILRRRIGRNELSVIQAMLAYADAQRDYASEDRNGNGLHEYAQKLKSTPGKHDGLYWDAKPDEPESPLGPLFAEAHEAGYKPGEHATPAPFFGYYFQVLNAQGTHARGGARDYLANGHMIGGFGLLAYPAKFGVSGVMTFIVNQDGIVYQRALGENTPEMAPRIDRFDPDPNWQKVKLSDMKLISASGD